MSPRPRLWNVHGLSRRSAHRMSESDGKSAAASTSADAAVLNPMILSSWAWCRRAAGRSRRPRSPPTRRRSRALRGRSTQMPLSPCCGSTTRQRRPASARPTTRNKTRRRRRAMRRRHPRTPTTPPYPHRSRQRRLGRQGSRRAHRPAHVHRRWSRRQPHDLWNERPQLFAPRSPQHHEQEPNSETCWRRPRHDPTRPQRRHQEPRTRTREKARPRSSPARSTPTPSPRHHACAPRVRLPEPIRLDGNAGGSLSVPLGGGTRELNATRVRCGRVRAPYVPICARSVGRPIVIGALVLRSVSKRRSTVFGV